MHQDKSFLAGFVLFAAALSPTSIARANLMFADNLQGNAAISATEKGVLQEAEAEWSSQFANNNAADGKNTFTITWENAGGLGAGTLAVATNYHADANGIPDSATIQVNRDILTAEDFFVDPTPADASEFTQPDADFPTHFAAKASAVDPASGQLISLETDLLSVILHEIGHAIGIAAAYDKFSAKLARAQVNGNRNFVFANGDFGVLSFNSEGTHVAGDQTGQLNGKPYNQLHDLMNPTVANGERNLITPLDVAMLTEAYGYTPPPAPIPEPGTFALAVMAMGLLLPRLSRRGSGNLIHT